MKTYAAIKFETDEHAIVPSTWVKTIDDEFYAYWCEEWESLSRQNASYDPSWGQWRIEIIAESSE